MKKQNTENQTAKILTPNFGNLKIEGVRIERLLRNRADYPRHYCLRCNQRNSLNFL